MNLNHCLIAGNITKDIELKALPSGSSVCSFSLAVNDVFKDKDGNKKETVDFINCVAFGKTAETIGQYCKKGHCIMVEGKIHTRSYEKDGQKRYVTEITVSRMHFVSKPTGEQRDTTEEDQNWAGTPAPVAKKQTAEIAYPEDEINPDDIPF
jgi:single-strand DNA-binding protein